MERFYKYIGCGDCQEMWTPYCPLCKQKGKHWKDENGHSVPSHQLTKKSLEILRNVTDYKATVEDRIITPPPKKNKKVKLITKNKKEINIPEQPLPINWENFFLATKGTFEEISKIPNGFSSFFKSKGSEYFINEDKTILIRESDHWGFGIRYCNWYLKGYGFEHCGNWKKKIDEPLKIGKINIIELSPSFKEKSKRFQHQEFESRHPI
jgi:hypothetical protein